MADLATTLDLNERDRAALAEIRAMSADWDEPLTDAEIARAAVSRLTNQWHQAPTEAERSGEMAAGGVRSRETIAAMLRDVARG